MMDDIERAQEEMKQLILEAIEQSATMGHMMNVTITIQDPVALAEILENVWVKSVDYGQLSCYGNEAELNIDTYGKREHKEPCPVPHNADWFRTMNESS